MSVKVRIPVVLTGHTQGRRQVEVPASTVRDLIDALDVSFPGIKARLCDENGEPRRMLNFFVNNSDIRFLEGTSTRLREGDHVSIVPLIAGG